MGKGKKKVFDKIILKTRKMLFIIILRCLPSLMNLPTASKQGNLWEIIYFFTANGREFIPRHPQAYNIKNPFYVMKFTPF